MMGKMLMIPYGEDFYAIPEEILNQYSLEGEQLEMARQGLKNTLDSLGDVEGQQNDLAVDIANLSGKAYQGLTRNDAAGRTWIWETNNNSSFGEGSWQRYSK